jgi:hypothetical protein
MTFSKLLAKWLTQQNEAQKKLTSLLHIFRSWYPVTLHISRMAFCHVTNQILRQCTPIIAGWTPVVLSFRQVHGAHVQLKSGLPREALLAKLADDLFFWWHEVTVC